MILLGVTGTMGCGKSSVVRRLAELGAKVLDADQAAREAVAPFGCGWQQLRDHFGPGILLADGQIDRRVLRERVVTDPRGLPLLEAVIHPLVFRAFARTLAELAPTEPTRPELVVAMEVPLLFESQADLRCDATLVVLCQDRQEERLASRGLSPEVRQALLARQWPEAAKAARADWVIDNRGEWSQTQREVDRVYALLDRCLAERPERAWPARWVTAGQDGIFAKRAFDNPEGFG